MYGITEKQSKKYYTLATKSDEITGIKYLSLLEQRLDNTVFRAGFAATRPQARQMVSHGLITVNGRKVKTPSILVKPGDVIEVKDKSKKSPLFEETKKAKIKTPKWLNSNVAQLQAEVVAIPDREDIEHIIDHQLITEFYSK